jgi:hypothetical protein
MHYDMVECDVCATKIGVVGHTQRRSSLALFQHKPDSKVHWAGVAINKGMWQGYYPENKLLSKAPRTENHKQYLQHGSRQGYLGGCAAISCVPPCCNQPGLAFIHLETLFST